MKLRDYQLEGVRFAHRNEAVFLMLDMGLGKTAMAIEWAKPLDRPALVIAPLRPAYSTWPEEIQKWWPGATWTILHGKKKNERLRYKRDFFIINYEGLPWLYNTLSKGTIKVKRFALVLDESSYIKDHGTKRFKLLKAMKPIFSPYRLCLSATPQPNGLWELWTQYFMLDDGKTLGKTYTPFRNMYFEYTGPPKFMTIPKANAQKDIMKMVEERTFRLDAKDYLKLPPLIYNDIKIDLPAPLMKAYKTLAKDGMLAIGKTEIEAKSDLAISSKLHQFCQGALYDVNKKAHEVHRLKVNALREMVDIANGEPMLVVVQFHFDVTMIEKVFGRLPKIVGGVSGKVAGGIVSRWNRGHIPVLLCHPQALSHGMNMQTGGRIITWYGLPWGSYEQYKQLNGRLHRHGQTKPVIVNNIVVNKAADIKIAGMLRRKGMNQQILLDYLRKITQERMYYEPKS